MPLAGPVHRALAAIAIVIVIHSSASAAPQRGPDLYAGAVSNRASPATSSEHPPEGVMVAQIPEIPDICGRSYHGARRLLVAAGWMPKPAPPPSDHLYGNLLVFRRLGYTEAVDCAGTGLGPCRFEFTAPTGETLVVVTLGDEDPQLQMRATVSYVGIDSPNADPPHNDCSGQAVSSL